MTDGWVRAHHEGLLMIDDLFLERLYTGVLSSFGWVSLHCPFSLDRQLVGWDFLDNDFASPQTNCDEV